MPGIGPLPARSSRSRTSRSGVVSTRLLAFGSGDCAARRQPAAPAQAAPREVAEVDLEDLVDVEVAPHLRQLLDLFRIRLLPRGEEGGVDAAGRHAGEDVGNVRREIRARGSAIRRPDRRRAHRRHSAPAQGPWASAIRVKMLTHPRFAAGPRCRDATGIFLAQQNGRECDMDQLAWFRVGVMLIVCGLLVAAWRWVPSDVARSGRDVRMGRAAPPCVVRAADGDGGVRCPRPVSGPAVDHRDRHRVRPAARTRSMRWRDASPARRSASASADCWASIALSGSAANG